MTETDRDLADLFRRTVPRVRPLDVDALLRSAGRAAPGNANSSHSAGRGGRRFLVRRVIAAAAALVVGVAGTAVWFLPREAGASLLFAAVQERVAETKTVTFVETERRGGRPPRVTRISVLGAGLMRADLPDGNYSILDLAGRRSFSVDRQKQRATLFEGFGPLARIEEPINLYDRLRNIQQDAVEPLPERMIDGRRAAGFVVAIQFGDHRHQMKVWVDPGTKLPVRIEETLDGGVERVSSEFRFDVELDASLFRFDPPEGYQLDTHGVAQLQPPPDDKSVAAPIVTPLVGIGPAKFGMSKDEIIQVLGEPDKIHSQEAGHGLDMLEYYSRGYGLHVSRRAGFFYGYAASGKTFAVQMRPFAGQTDKGIGLGASEADIRRAYGEPDRVEEPTLRDVFGDDTPQPDRKSGQKTLYYDDLRTWFSLQHGKLDDIMIRADVRKLLEEKGLLREE